MEYNRDAEIKERYNRLEREGIILSKLLEKELIKLGVLPDRGESVSEYYLEDLLKLMPLLNHPSFFKMFFDSDKNAIVLLEDGRLPSEEIRATSITFVNAAGRFIIEAIERGFVRTDWKTLLKEGLQTSEYWVRSNGRGQDQHRNWISRTFLEVLKEKSLWSLIKINFFK